MKEIEALRALISSLKAYSVFGDLGITLILIIGILLTYFWQKKKIESLEDYVELWRPRHLKTELESYFAIKDEINEATLEQYKKELQESKDKEREALRIINDLQHKNSGLLSKLLSEGTATLMDMAPSGGDAIADREQDAVIWTLKFRNGTIKQFKFPITKTKGEPEST